MIKSRDLHLNNILVIQEFLPHQPPSQSSQFSAKVADIGEGQHVATTSNFNASVEARDLHAPEILSSRTWSTASDVFAFAVAICKTLDMRQELCPERAFERVTNMVALEPTGETAFILPLGLREMIINGLSSDFKDRWTIMEYVDAFVDIGDDFFAEREDNILQVQWATLEWWKTYIEAYNQKPADRNQTQLECTWSTISEAN